MPAQSSTKFMDRAIKLAQSGMDSNKGGPFGAIVVKNDQIVGEGCNIVTSSNDPTAHAEVVAIRNACKNLNTFHLTGCEIYCSCEPCPMCLGAIYWARLEKIYFASNRKRAAYSGFDDDFIYKELSLGLDQRSIEMTQILENEGDKLFVTWMRKANRIGY